MVDRGGRSARVIAARIPPRDPGRLGPDVPVAGIRAFGHRLRGEYRDIARQEVPLIRVAAALALGMDG
jgi:hypothetical protein